MKIFQHNLKLRTQNLELSGGRKRLSEEGVTIIEALMVMAVIGFVMSLIATLAWFGVSSWQKQSTRIQIETQAQGFFYILTEKLRQAQPSTVSISNYPGEMNESMITFTPTNQSSPISIYLKTLTGPGGQITDRQILMFEPEYAVNTAVASYSAGGQVLASNVVSLYFTYPMISDTSRIMVSLSQEKYPFKNKPPVNFQSTQVIYVRN